jgi:hypothetical protein
MKVRFRYNDVKILVTRISGDFQIYDDDEKRWTTGFSKGSFKITNKNIYDDILKILIRVDKEKKFKDIVWIIFEINKGIVNCVIDLEVKKNDMPEFNEIFKI